MKAYLTKREGSALLRSLPEVLAGECVETTGREAELFGGLDGGERLLSEVVEHMADE